MQNTFSNDLALVVDESLDPLPAKYLIKPVKRQK